MRKRSPILLVCVGAMMLMACTCYGMTTVSTYSVFTVYLDILLGRTPQALDCSRFYFTNTVSDASGNTQVAWNAQNDTIGLFVYHGDTQIYEESFDVDNAHGRFMNFTIDWNNLGAPDSVDVELREIGRGGDVCVIRTSFNRPQITHSENGMVCANLALTSPLGGMANGVETFYWNPLAGATTYRLNFSYNGVALFSVETGGDVTNTSINVSQSAIGGETPLLVELVALDANGNQCSQSYTIAREAAPPQNPAPVSPSATPTCEERPTAPYC